MIHLHQVRSLRINDPLPRIVSHQNLQLYKTMFVLPELNLQWQQDERNEEIGIIAAEEVLEFIETEIAAQIYSKALLDAKTIAKQQFEELDFKLTEKTLK